MASSKLFAVVMLVIVVGVLFSESEAGRYCNMDLVGKIHTTCLPRWLKRRKRDTEGVELEDYKAKAFNLAHSRVKRGWFGGKSMSGECCEERCSTEEVREIC